jgi:hypothetical protein
MRKKTRMDQLQQLFKLLGFDDSDIADILAKEAKKTETMPITVGIPPFL